MDPRYPIGRYEAPDPITANHVADWIDEIKSLPADLHRVVEALSEERLRQRYRPGGWTVRVPVSVSLNLLEALHHRWGVLLESLDASDYSREFVHPEIGTMTVAWNIGQYAWHGRHHLAHIDIVSRGEGHD